MVSKKLTRALLLAAALVGCSAAAPAFAQVKIGFVNTVKLMEQSPQAKAASARVEAEFAPREKKLVAAQKQVKQLEDKLNRNGAVMSKGERTKLQREIAKKKRDFSRGQDEFRQDLNIRRNEELSKLQHELYKAIVALAKEKHYDLVVGDGAIYASDRVNITQEVLDRLKASYKAPKSGSKK
ncbi:MAG: OmpH family outer membrane protein [Gammaproteobacteria bacterium]